MRSEVRFPEKSGGSGVKSLRLWCLTSNVSRRGAGCDIRVAIPFIYSAEILSDRDLSRPMWSGMTWRKGSEGDSSPSLKSDTLMGEDFERSSILEVVYAPWQDSSVHKDGRAIKISLQARQTCVNAIISLASRQSPKKSGIEPRISGGI